MGSRASHSKVAIGAVGNQLAILPLDLRLAEKIEFASAFSASNK